MYFRGDGVNYSAERLIAVRKRLLELQLMEFHAWELNHWNSTENYVCYFTQHALDFTQTELLQAAAGKYLQVRLSIAITGVRLLTGTA